MNQRRSPPQVREISPAAAKRLIEEGALLIDVREPAEIAAQAFDVQGIITIPLGQLPARLVDIPRDRDLILACKAGGRSYNAAGFLLSQGYERVANLEGGIMLWASQGLPVKG